jgi:D-glycero-beta-D-manno-heptose 1-phosphate adenylyltransferase
MPGTFISCNRPARRATCSSSRSTASVRALKGPGRPVQSEHERAFALSALSCTDALCIFREPRLTAEIRALRPDLYVKAGDYSLEKLDATERAALQDAGADIRFLPFLPGFSSTDLIRRISSADRPA